MRHSPMKADRTSDNAQESNDASGASGVSGSKIQKALQIR